VNFFMVYDTNLHQLNLEKNRNLRLLDEIPFKKCVFKQFFISECTIIFFF